MSIPTYNQKTVNNIIRLRRGQAVLVGGFKKATQTLVDNSVPLLSSLPVLGSVFKSKKLSHSDITTYILIEYMEDDIPAKAIKHEFSQFNKDELLGLF